jgi:voltage-gated potassium channel
MRKTENNFTYMLIALGVFLIGVPASHDFELLSVGAVRALGISALIAIGIWSLKGTGRKFGAAMILAAIGLLLNLIDATRSDSLVYLAANVATLAFLLFSTVESFRRIASSNTMSGNRIIGAICVYLLLGVIWSICYAILEYLVPNSFAGIGDPASQSPDWIYFSFVTLTTLGYGDILPLTFIARALSYSEAVVGQFYVAILVAGLVSAYIADKQAARPDDQL